MNNSDTNKCLEQKNTSKLGRPVDKSRDLAILNAALELIAEYGYESVTIEAIAQKAGAGKATLYRRWKSKPQLVADALASILPCEQEIQLWRCKDNLRDYLCELLGVYFGVKDEVRQKVMLSIATTLSRDKELSANVHLDSISKQSCTLRKAIECAIGSNLNKNQLELITNTGPALLFYQLIITGRSIDMSYVEHVVDDLLMPLIELKLCCLK
ncbi:MAG: helix-turn-helix domain-containing protein [Proteocatella sp.]